MQVKNKTRTQSAGLGGEELSENKQLIEETMKRFEESKPRTKAGTQKRQCTSKIKKRKLKN